MTDRTAAPTPAQIRAAVAMVTERAAKRFAEVPDSALATDATDTQYGAIALLRVLLTGADALITALASGDDDAVDSAVNAVAGQPLLRDLAGHRPGDAGV